MTVRNMSKRYGEFQALTDINLDVRRSEALCLIGPSGSGKNTLLRCGTRSNTTPAKCAEGQLYRLARYGAPRIKDTAAVLRAQREAGMVFPEEIWHFQALQMSPKPLREKIVKARHEGTDLERNQFEQGREHPSGHPAANSNASPLRAPLPWNPHDALFDEMTSTRSGIKWRGLSTSESDKAEG
jgi:polar amino acid transport system ATP-binding protein